MRKNMLKYFFDMTQPGFSGSVLKFSPPGYIYPMTPFITAVKKICREKREYTGYSEGKCFGGRTDQI